MGYSKGSSGTVAGATISRVTALAVAGRERGQGLSQRHERG
ncbi:MAG: hypothetical protein ACKO35_10650 [Planctomycetaceae bacterium]